jgi:hypothetical protein
LIPGYGARPGRIRANSQNGTYIAPWWYNLFRSNQSGAPVKNYTQTL